ncbi:hypothetical protein [Cellulomonas palmilytica]|uniref:hypothetical protein n=1 Tax=Cellulomonas palmilytica TaxID=2608402 RepID=UPI001F326991|nr:hypothetical protein [Cellulomonas palmilytica]UJP39626.1 hypothetical protein F1D97_15150 [Cellulomonas palmilytica]
MTTRRSPGRAAAALACSLLVGGCAYGPSSADTSAVLTMTAALDEATSAVEVGLLVVDLVARDRTTTPVADGTLRDALEEVGSAHRSLADALPPLDRQDSRARALDAVASATTALATARAWVDDLSAGSARDVAAALTDAGDAIDAVTTDLEAGA